MSSSAGNSRIVGGDNPSISSPPSVTEVTFQSTPSLHESTKYGSNLNGSVTSSRFIVDATPNNEDLVNNQNIMLSYAKVDDASSYTFDYDFMGDEEDLDEDQDSNDASRDYDTERMKALTSFAYNPKKANHFIRTSTASVEARGVGVGVGGANRSTLCISGSQPSEVQIDLSNCLQQQQPHFSKETSHHDYNSMIIQTSSFCVHEPPPFTTAEVSNQNNTTPYWKIICVDSNANLILLHLHYESLHPFQISYLRTEPISKTVLSPSQLTFPSHNQFLYINQQHQIVNYHIPSNTYVIWKTVDQCLDVKKKSLGYFTCAKGYIMGKSPLDIVSSNDDVDSNSNGNNDAMILNEMDSDKTAKNIIPSTIAICTMGHIEKKTNDIAITMNVDDDDENDDGYKSNVIGSLHIDGSIRLWTLLPTPTSTYVTFISKMKLYPLKGQKLSSSSQTSQHWTSSMLQTYYEKTVLTEQQSDKRKYEVNLSFKGTLFNTLDNSDSSSSDGGLLSVFLQMFKNDDDNESKPNRFFSTFSFEKQLENSNTIHDMKIHDLIIPSNTQSIVGMDFTTMNEFDNHGSNSNDGCALNVLYECTTESNVKSIILSKDDFIAQGGEEESFKSVELAIYKPFSIDRTPSSQVQVLHPFLMCEHDQSFTIDSRRLQTREDIILQSNILCENSQSDLNVDDDDNDSVKMEQMMTTVDGIYMKQIYRPYPGEKIGSKSSIRRALKKILSYLAMEGVNIDNILSVDNIELKTVLTMKKWAIYSDEMEASKNSYGEDDMDVDMSPPSMIGESLDGNPELSSDGNPELSDDFDKAQKILCHHKRWTQLLLVISGEEAKLQKPISFAILPSNSSSNDGGIILRAGNTSQLCVSGATDLNSSSGLDKLDQIAISLFYKISGSVSTRSLLVDFEIKIREIISKAKLIFDEDAAEIDQLFNLILPVINRDSLGGILDSVTNIVQGTKRGEITQWLSSPLYLNGTSDLVLGPNMNTKMKSVLNEAGSFEMTPFAADLVSNYLDQVYHLSLARCILVAAVSELSDLTTFRAGDVETSLHTFLQSVAMTWLHSQVAVLPSNEVSKEGSKVPPILAFSPVAKRARTKLIQSKVQQSILEFGVKRHYQTTGKLTLCKSPMEEIVALSKSYIQILLDPKNELPSFIDELSNSSRLSLRILAPLALYSNETQQGDGFNSCMKLVKNILTEVDAMASSNCLSQAKAKKVLNHVSTILYKNCVNEIPRKFASDTFFCVLRSLPDDWISSTSVSSDQFHNENLVELLNIVLQKYKNEVRSEDIVQLSKLDFLRKLMLPWIIASQRERHDARQSMINSLAKAVSEPEKVFEDSILVLLRISQMMSLMSIFESHVANTSNEILKVSYSQTLLSIVSDIIVETETNFSPDICEVITDYSSMWSAAFRHALNAQQWDKAFKACLSNPLEDRREKNFERLVLAMVDAGEFNKLLNSILLTVVERQKSHSDEHTDVSRILDLHDIASKCLVQAASERSSITPSEWSSRKSANYTGCLYTLHAFHNEWRRCCQVMDFYGKIAQENLFMSQESSISALERKKLDQICINDIVLSSVTSSQLINLITAENGRYIVSGELCSNPIPPPFRGSNTTQSSNTESIQKRTRENSKSSLTISSLAQSSSSTLKRSSRLLTEVQLSSRATRYIAVRTLFNDALSPESLSAIIGSSDAELIEALSRLGYYSHAIAIVNCKKNDTNGAFPGGRDVIADTISHMINRHVIPYVLKQMHPNAEKDFIDEDDGIHYRPTLSQLRLESEASPLPLACDLFYSDSRNEGADKGSIALGIVRTLTLTYASQYNSLAMEVAETFLDLESGNAKLPLWLYDLLIGRSQNSQNDSLFANRNAGDPAALVRLYIKKGFLSAACTAVNQVLKGNGKRKGHHATNRLPEKGNIDFVPYPLIDKLWNTINFFLQSKDCDPSTKDQLQNDRRGLEEALELHFKLLKVSEMGVLSARALNSK